MPARRVWLLDRPAAVDSGHTCAYASRMMMHWPSVDPLGEALYFLRMTGLFYTRSELRAPWGLALPALPDTVMFHVVTAGQCWLKAAGAEPMVLQPSTVTLVAHGEEQRRCGCAPAGGSGGAWSPGAGAAAA